MYVQITTRCNMRCAHCCFSCGPRGTDMTREVFVAACKLAESRGDNIFLGGGEPTVHPMFWDFLGLALRHDSSDMQVGLVTNGKKTEDAIVLARMAKRGVISADLSRDQYHEDIDFKVVQAFTKSSSERSNLFSHHDNDLRSVRSNHLEPWAVGRGKKLSEAKKPKPGEWCCGDLHIDPDGTIRHCSCDNSPQYDTVFKPDIPDDYISTTCYREQERDREEEHERLARQVAATPDSELVPA